MKYPDSIGRPFLTTRFLIASLSLVIIFAMGFPFPIFEKLGKILFYLFLVVFCVDFVLLYLSKHHLTVKRIIDYKLSNGDSNPIKYSIQGQFNFVPEITLIDEYPAQLQLRKQFFHLSPETKIFNEEIPFDIHPKVRGEYYFGDIHLLISSKIGLIERKVKHDAAEVVKVYPSVIQYKKYSFLAFTNRLTEIGVKKVRKVGSSTEFEQIKEFQRGDNVKRINWKATARRDELMVNHYEDEKAQNIYFVIDKGRSMHMPFNGLSLFDYAVNSTLAMAGVAKTNGDKVGLITFSDVIGSWIPAHNRQNHITLINEALYHQRTRMKESDYLRLYKNVNTRIKGRSLLILFTNFSSIISLKRQVKYLRALSKSHLVLIISFENEAIQKVANTRTDSYEGYFDQSVAEKFLQEKTRITQELKLLGIHSILTRPENLTVNTINKYLEIKSRGLL